MRRNERKPQPPRHGQIRVSSMKHSHAKAHLAMITDGMNQVRDYNAYNPDSRGAFAPSSASGATYVTNSMDTPDSDWGGESR